MPCRGSMGFALCFGLGQLHHVRRCRLRRACQRRQDALLRVSEGSGRATIDPAAHRQGGPAHAKVQAARIL